MLIRHGAVVVPTDVIDDLEGLYFENAGNRKVGIGPST
jgi:hypothetical protein